MQEKGFLMCSKKSIDDFFLSPLPRIPASNVASTKQVTIHFKSKLFLRRGAKIKCKRTGETFCKKKQYDPWQKVKKKARYIWHSKCKMRIQVKVRLQYVLKNPECKPPFSPRNQMFAPLKQVNERISTVVAPPPFPPTRLTIANSKTAVTKTNIKINTNVIHKITFS